MACHVEEDDISFLYSLQSGMSTDSYAMEVALMAGVPRGLVERARLRSEAAQKIQKQTDVRMQKQHQNWVLFAECLKVIHTGFNDLGKLADLQFRYLCRDSN